MSNIAGLAVIVAATLAVCGFIGVARARRLGSRSGFARGVVRGASYPLVGGAVGLLVGLGSGVSSRSSPPPYTHWDVRTTLYEVTIYSERMTDAKFQASRGEYEHRKFYPMAVLAAVGSIVGWGASRPNPSRSPDAEPGRVLSSGDS
jgi:hypothetical protein